MRITTILNVVFLIGAFLLGGASSALAWGDEGHEVVCQIAYMELSPVARQHVDNLIAQDAQFREFAKSCTWPDHPRQRPGEHFLNVDRTQVNVDPAKPCGTASTCVVTAVVNDTRDLALAPDGPNALRLLKSLGHWVGDIHQPLHISFEDDRGGNKVYVTGPCDNNLHSVWDTCILQETIGEDANSVAIDLRGEVTQQQRTDWTAGDVTLNSVIGWAEESLDISRSRDVGYCILKGNVCQYDENRVTYDGQRTRSIPVDRTYLQNESELVRTRLKMAGIRLGAVLEKIFGDQDQVAAAANLQEFSLKRIVDVRPTNASPHLVNLSGTLAAPSVQPSGDATQQQINALTDRVKELEAEVAALKSK